MKDVHTLEFLILNCVLAISVWTDIRFRRVPNEFLYVGLIAYMILLYWFGLDPWFSLKGGILGLIVFLPFYLLGGMGAADLKLLGLVGVYLGSQGVLYSALYTALAGGMLAILVLILRTSRRLPYAVAIAVGTGIYEGTYAWHQSFMSF